jgi:hypothetical protein
MSKDHVVLSIIITNWNTRELLRVLLASIVHHPPVTSFEILVVDNGSKDGSAAMVRQEFPDVRLIENSGNRGYAVANNQGYAASQGNLILLLGSDTVIIDESLQRMTEYLREHTEAGAVTCRLLNPEGTPQLSCRRFPTLGDAVLTYLSLHRFARRYTMAGFDSGRTQEVEQPAATCLMVRRDLLDSIGLFDERFTILYNDVEFCRRIRQTGRPIIYLGTAEIVHYGSQSTRQASPSLRLEMYRNILLYYQHTLGWHTRWILLPILMVRLLAATRSRLAFQLLNPLRHEAQNDR